MIWRIALSALIVLGLWVNSQAQLLLTHAGKGGFAAPSGCTEATNFLARNGNTDPTEFTNLICGLVAQASTISGTLWSRTDILYVFATDTVAHASLNLKGATFNGTANGTLTSTGFTANRGFQSTDGSSTDYFDTTFNPATAGGQFTQNNNHAAIWSNTNGITNTAGGFGARNASFSFIEVVPWFTGNLFIARTNDSGGTFTSNSNSLGHFLTTRNSSTTAQNYINGVAQAGYVPGTSLSTPSLNLYAASMNVNGTPTGSPLQQMAAHAGASLSATDVANYCHLLNVYLTAKGGVGSVC